MFAPGDKSSDTDVRINCNATTYSGEGITGTILENAYLLLYANDTLTAERILGVVVTSAATKIDSALEHVWELIQLSGELGTDTGTGDAVVKLNSVSALAASDLKINNYLEVNATGNVKDGFNISKDGGGNVIFKTFANVTAVDTGILTKVSGSGSSSTVEVTDAAVTAKTAVEFKGGAGTLNVDKSTIKGDVIFAVGPDADVLDLRGSIIGTENGSDKIYFSGGGDTMTVNQGIVYSKVNFGVGNDVLTLDTWARINGDLNFGIGDDKLIMDVGISDDLGPSVISGDITGIQTMTKDGSGDVRLGAEGKIVIFNNFSDNAKPSLILNEGGLIIAGVIDLNDGDVVIHDATKLTFEIIGKGKYGKFKNATAVFMSDDYREIYTQLAYGSSSANLANEAFNFVDNFVDNTADKVAVEVTVKTTDDDETTVGKIAAGSNTFKCTTDDVCNKIAVALAAKTPSTLAELNSAASPGSGRGSGRGSGGDSSNNDTLLGIGLVAAIYYFWNSDFFGGNYTDYGYDISSLRSGSVSLTGDVPFSQGNTFRVHGSNSHVWVRSLADSDSNLSLGSYAKAQGTELGMNHDLGKGFRFNGSIIPEMSVSSPRSKLEGRVMQLGGSWRKDNFFTGLKLVHEDHDAELVTANPLVNSYLQGNSALSNTHLHLQTGTMMNYGSVKAKTMFSMFAGDMTQAAYTAESPVMKTDIPEISQNYEGWRFGLNLTPSKAIETSGGTRMLPSMTLSTMRTTTSGLEAMTLSQSDKAGVLTFRTNVQVRELPKTVNVLGLSTRIRQSANSGWKLGYAGAEIDGEFHNYALANYRMRF